MVLLRHPKNSRGPGALPGDWQKAQTRITIPDQNIARRTEPRRLFGLGFRSVGAGGPFCNKPLVVHSRQWPPCLQALAQAQSPAQSPVAYHPFRFILLTRVPLASKCDVGSCGLRNVMWVPPSCGASRGCPPHCPPKLTSGFLNRAPTPLPPKTMLRVRSGRGRKCFSGYRENRFGTQHCLGGEGGAAESEVKF